MATTVQQPPLVPAQNEQGKKRLFIFGIVLIVLGSFFGFTSLSLLMGSTVVLTPRPTRPPLVPVWTPPFLLLLALTGIFIWTGIGSIKLRRWTRPVMVAFAAIMIFGAVVTLLQVVINLAAESFIADPTVASIPRRRTPSPPPMPSALAQAIALGVVLVVGVAIPLIVLLTYRSRAVELALDEADSELTWTDRCPLSVFILAAGLAWFGYLAVLGFMPSPIKYLTANDSQILELLFQFVLAALLAMAALMVYRQHPGSPWTAIALVACIAASTMLASSDVATNDPPQLHWQSWSVQEHVAAAQASALHTMLGTLAFVLPAIASILYARRQMT